MKPKSNIHLLMSIAYIVFFIAMGLFVNNDYTTAIHVNLDDKPVFLREGMSRSDLAAPDTSAEGWVDLTGKSWRIQDSGLVDPYKKPFLNPQDETPRYFVYVIEFDFSSEQLVNLRRGAMTPGLFLPSIADNWEIYLNGNLIARYMYTDAEGNILRHQNTQMNGLPFDPGYLVDGKNQLVIRVLTTPWYGDAGLYYKGGYYIDDYRQIQSQHDGLILLFISGVYFFAAFYNVLVYLGSVRERYFAYFAADSFLLGIYTLMNTPFSTRYFENSALPQLLEFSSLALMPIPMILFVHTIVRKRIHLASKIGMGISFALAAAMPFVGLQARLNLLLLAEAMVMFHIVCGLIVAVRFMIAESKLFARIRHVSIPQAVSSLLFGNLGGDIFIGLVFVSAAAIFGLYEAVILTKEPTIMLHLLPGFVISISFALANDVSKTKHAITQQNKILEERVSERTRDLEEQTKIAISANRSKSEFLATMSHEIRTPMNAIIGASEMELRRPHLPEELQQSLSLINTSGKGLLGIINDILDLSKVESGRFDLVEAEYRVSSMLSDTTQMNLMRIGGKPIIFELALEENLPEILFGDELRIKQILSNILSNAFKYTDEGRVVMSVTAAYPADDHEHITLTFKVSDTGQGMTPEQLSKLFLEEYARFNQSENRMIEGTGLGMRITKHLVELMGGDIAVESTFGVGSTFTVSLPQKVVGNGVIDAETAKKLASFNFHEMKAFDKKQLKFAEMPHGRVLVVDDVAANLYVARGLMIVHQLTVETASSGFEAIERIKNGETYDMIFMDHMMPKMDGIEATKHLRDLGFRGPIVALTANALAGNAEKFKAAGMDDYVAKPIDSGDLYAVLKTWMPASAYSSLSNIDEVPKSPKEENAPAPFALTGVDVAHGIDMCGGNPDVYLDILKVFAKDIEPRLPYLQGFADTPDADENQLKDFTIVVHGMKSTLGTIGAAALSEAAKELEGLGDDQNIEEIHSKLPPFVAAMSDLYGEIRGVLHDRPTGEEGTAELDRAWAERMRKLLADEDLIGASAALDEVQDLPLGEAGKELLEALADCLLMANCEEGVEAVDRYLAG
jgi:signal transduction histidine kinase/CheY-like chemotaxis protein/HPt (histidine-containing phosphotransfer) domain-containing protein